MNRLLTLVFLLISSVAHADDGWVRFIVPGGTSFTGGAITTPILAPAAPNCSTPSYSFAGDTDSGFCSTNAGLVGIYGDGTDVMMFQFGVVYIPAYTQLLFTDGSYGSTHSSFLGRGATGTLWLRSSPSFPQHQEFHWTYSWSDGSNYQGGVLKTSATGIQLAAETAGSGADDLDITLAPAGTGKVVINGGLLASSSAWIGLQSNLQPTTNGTIWLGYPTTQWQHLFVAESIQGSKTKALTEASATAVTQIAVPQTAGANFADAVVQWTVYATDGTDTQTRRGSTYLAAVNKAGTETCTVGDLGTPVVAVSAGTLTCTTSCITGLTDVVQFALDCTSSLTQSTLNAMVRLDMDQTNAVAPQ